MLTNAHKCSQMLTNAVQTSTSRLTLFLEHLRSRALATQLITLTWRAFAFADIAMLFLTEEAALLLFIAVVPQFI